MVSPGRCPCTYTDLLRTKSCPTPYKIFMVGATISPPVAVTLLGPHVKLREPRCCQPRLLRKATHRPTAGQSRTDPRNSEGSNVRRTRTTCRGSPVGARQISLLTLGVALLATGALRGLAPLRIDRGFFRPSGAMLGWLAPSAVAHPPPWPPFFPRDSKRCTYGPRTPPAQTWQARSPFRPLLWYLPGSLGFSAG